MDKQLLNVVLLGIAFFLIFTSFQTGGIIQKIVTNSINQDYNVNWDGYTSLSIIYFVFAISNFIAPLTLSLIGAKYSMIAGAVTYCLFIANFLYPVKPSLYIASVIIGIGAAIIWTGQGNFLTVNSNPDTIARNSGLELSFFSGVYGTAIGSAKALGADAQKLLGISGMLIGVGEISGGALFGLLGSKTTKSGREPVVLLGYLTHMIAFSLIYINLPKEASIRETSGNGFINSSVTIALLCSLLLGFGDSCYNTQIYSMLGSLYADDSAPAFAMFKFIQSVATAVAFYYSNLVYLDSHVYVLAVFGTMATLSFCMIEWSNRRQALNEKLEQSDKSNSTSQVSAAPSTTTLATTLSCKL